MKLKIGILTLLFLSVASAQIQPIQFDKFTLKTPISICGTWTGEGYAATKQATLLLQAHAKVICAPQNLIVGPTGCGINTPGRSGPIFFQQFRCLP